MAHSNSSAQQIHIDDFAYSLTLSLVHQAADTLPARDGDAGDDLEKAVEITLDFIQRHGPYQDWPIVAYLAVAAVRRVGESVTREDMSRVLADSPTRHVRQRTMIGLIPLVFAA